MSEIGISTKRNRFKEMLLEIALNNGFYSFEEYIASKYNKSMDKALIFKKHITDNNVLINII